MPERRLCPEQDLAYCQRSAVSGQRSAVSGQREHALHSPFVGAPTSAGPVDLASLVDQKDDLIERLRGATYLDVAAALGFEIRRGHARFACPELLLVDGEPLPARAYVVATGSVSLTPELPGLDDVDWLTSMTAMELTTLPESLIVIGGGYVGMEQAQLFARLGTRVTLVGRLAPHAEPELRDVLRRAFERSGITLVEERASAVAASGGGVTVTTSGGGPITAARVLVATGSPPRTDGLNLDRARMVLDDNGFVEVDRRQQTSSSRVCAAGDVSEAPQYVYVAAATGRVAAVNTLGGSDEVDFTGLPQVTFTRQQLASAGMTEEQALAAGHDCDCRTLDGTDIPHALANQDTLGALQIVSDADSGRVLGVHAALDGGGDAVAYAVSFGLGRSGRAELGGHGRTVLLDHQGRG